MHRIPTWKEAPLTGAPSFRLRATLLPDGDRPLDLWVVGDRLTTTPQDEATELGPREGFLLPGLVDAHVHLTAGRGDGEPPRGSMELVNVKRRQHLEEGTLLLRDMGALFPRERAPGEDRVATLRLEPHDGLPPVRAAGELLAPEGTFTGGQRPTAPGELAAVAAAQVRQGASWVKVVLDNFPADHRPAVRGADMLNYDEPALRSAVEAAHGLGARVAVHAFTPEGAEIAVAAGADSLEHGWGLEASQLDAMAAGGMAWTPTLCIADVMKNFGHEGDRAVARWIDEATEALRPMLVEAVARGVPVLAGTDSLAGVATEVACLQQAGLEPRQALAAGSTAARAFLDGAVEVREGAAGLSALEGTVADLVLYEADPRDDPEILRRPSLVMLDGRIAVEAS